MIGFAIFDCRIAIEDLRLPRPSSRGVSPKADTDYFCHREHKDFFREHDSAFFFSANKLPIYSKRERF